MWGRHGGRSVAGMDLRVPGVAVASFLVLAGVVGRAEATVPGANGRIAFASFSNRLDELTLGETITESIDVVSANGRGRRSLRSCTRVQGENWVRLAPDVGDWSIEYTSPAWSPDGKRIAFDAGTQLAVIRSDGTGFRLLPAQSANDGDPAWSPDGRKLVFSGARGADPAAGTDLYTLDLASGSSRRLTFRGGRDRAPAWSSRGRIAFTRGGQTLAPDAPGAFRPGSGNVYTVRPDGRALRQLTYRSGSDPSWSPHAGKIVFVRGRRIHGAWRQRLFAVRADGSDLHPVTTPGADSPDHPSWSPDGKLIAYHGFDSGVWVQRLDGRSLRQVVAGASGGAYHFDASEPDWQPLPGSR